MKSERPKDPVKIKKTFNFRVNRALAGLYNFIYRKGLNYQALSVEESLQWLLRTRKSYIRLGNGESEIFVGLDMFTQVYDEKLKEALTEIIRNYSPDCNYLMGLVNWRLTQSVSQLKATPGRSAFKIWRFMRYVFWKLNMEDIRMPFLEADMFRAGPAGLARERIELLWKDAANIIAVYNSEEHIRRFRDKHPEKRVFFIGIPDKNCFASVQKIQDNIYRVIKENNIDRNDLAVLVSAGPAAKVLCYNLCQKNDTLLCYDIGNFFHMHYQAAISQKTGNS